jgi:purine-cytosine permease-like protein
MNRNSRIVKALIVTSLVVVLVIFTVVLGGKITMTIAMYEGAFAIDNLLDPTKRNRDIVLYAQIIVGLLLGFSLMLYSSYSFFKEFILSTGTAFQRRLLVNVVTYLLGILLSGIGLAGIFILIARAFLPPF